jgi:hypothetical protein
VGWFLRRPLGLFAAIVVAGVVVIAVGLQVSGGTAGVPAYSATSLSSAQFTRLGERACVSLRRQLRDVTGTRPRSRKAAARSVRAVASTLADLNTELDGRVPPPSQAASFRRLLGGIQTTGRAMNQLEHLIETHQWQRATLLVRSPAWRAVGERLEPSANGRSKRCGPNRRTDAILAAVAVRVAGGTAAASYYFARPLSVEEFGHNVERICVAARGQLEQITSERPASLPDAASKIDTLTSSLDDFLTELRGLTPPPSYRVPFRHVLGDLQAEDRAMHDLNELARLGQWQDAERLVRSRRWQDMLRRFGPPVDPADIHCG